MTKARQKGQAKERRYFRNSIRKEKNEKEKNACFFQYSARKQNFNCVCLINTVYLI